MTLVLTLIYIFSVLAMGFSICWLMLRATHGMMTYMFIGCQTSIIIWLISLIIGIQAISLKQFVLAYNIGNFGICFIGMTWLLFSIYYIGRRPPEWFVALLTLISVSLYACALTNEKHHLYYSQMRFHRVEYAPLFYVNQVYIYICLLVGIALIFMHCRRFPKFSRGQAALIMIAAALPLLLNLLTLTGVIRAGFSVAPTSFAVSSVLVLLATYRYGFLDVNEVAFEDAFNTIEEGVIVFNRRGMMTYLSKAAERMLGVHTKISFLDLVEHLNVPPDFMCHEIERNEKRFVLKRYFYRDVKGTPMASTLIISDITRYFLLVERTAELGRTEQKLAVEQERNRIAQEVHDTVGHSLTMISSLARLSQVGLNDGKGEKLGEYLEQIESISRSGLMQLRSSVNNLRDDRFMTTAVSAVKALAETVVGLDVELCVQGEEDERFSHCIRPVYDSVRELITNCLRYSSADRMDIIIKFLDRSLDLYVIDNGKGCEEIKEGNGLRGIRERIERIDGTVKFSSGADSGFTTVIKIPVHARSEKSNK